ncbi:MAG TPA: ATP-binding protein, partial [Albitalea sp.]|nr:ATP-binding protein [Albitalea sp.]
MGEMSNEGASLSAGIDLSQFYQVFFEEAGENLDRMEQQLLDIDIEDADDEELNSIFRCAHSVKGGAATFGFSDVAELTHQMETLLDKLRRRELSPTAAMVDVLLQSGDALRAQLARHQGGGGAEIDTTELLFNIRAMVAGETPPSVNPVVFPVAAAAAAAPSTPAAEPAAPAAPAGTPAGNMPTTARSVEARIGPMDDPAQADNLVELFREITDLGTIEPIDGGQAADGIRRFRITTTSSDSDLLDLFTFHVAREHVQLMPLGPGYGFHEGNPGVPPAEAHDDPGYGFFEDAPGAPGAASDARAPAAAAAAPQAAPSTARARAVARQEKAPAAALESSTLRVSVEKVDQLINLVGELVITQAMLAQNSKQMDPALYQQMAAGLADLDRNTRDLQESVMSIRMIPMSVVFNRFPRMLRDLAAKLGKKVEFVTHGEATELDKGLVEKITDPLTHLVRNSCDHGIELPADRLARGKPEHGTITLSASHQGGSIVIEVRDDGRGLDREKILAKARAGGMALPPDISDADVWQLIFAPGFSTADIVTDISGRGVGMDVVRRNILALGGSVDLDSAPGRGTCVRVRLPLTLAIMDGMSVAVGGELYLLPLASVVESFQPQPDVVKTMAGGARVVKVRGEYLPVVRLGQAMGLHKFDDGVPRMLVLVQAEARTVALEVDQLVGQQQVVVKNLEAN